MSNYVDYDNAVELFTEVGNKRKASESMQETLLKSTVGWTGKNLLENTASSRTVNGVAVTVNADGSITLNGTHTASTSDFQVQTHVEDIIANGMIISGVPSGASNVKLRISLNQSPWTQFAIDTGNGATISGYSSQTNVNCNLTLVGNGTVYDNVTIYPMLRDASITDDTYEPYHESVEEEIEQIYADNGVLGAKNLMHYPYNEEKTSVDVTLTVDSDGVINLNGTQGSSTLGQYYLSRRFNYDFQLPAGTYKLTGGSTDTWLDIGVNNVTGDASQGSTTLGQDRGNGLTFTLDKLSDVQVILFIDKNKTFTNKKIYPMLRLASDPDDTYVPYAMTNRELTDAASLIIPNRMLSGYYKDWYSGSHDLNDLGVGEVATISGSNASNISHMPTGVSSACGAYTISVYGNYLRQFLLLRDTPAMYTRTRSQEGTWTNWYSFTMSIIS